MREKIPRLGNMLSVSLFFKHVSLSVLKKESSVLMFCFSESYEIDQSGKDLIFH